MGVTVFTGGVNKQAIGIIVSGIPSGKTVKAWLQGVSYPLTPYAADYAGAVPLLGTYTITRNDKHGEYRDVYCYQAGTYNVTW